MEKIRLRKIKGTLLEKSIAITIVILLVVCICLFPLDTNEGTARYFEKKETKETIAKLNFSGEKKNTLEFNEKFAEVTYEENGKDVSHIVNLKTGKEVPRKDILKDEEAFNKKVHELLLKAYPSFIVNILEKSPSNYNFRLNDLYITYDISKSGLETNRKFYLIVDYNEIYEYLDFTVELNEAYTNMDGYNYDPSKVTIALTFDDGPNGERTKRLINALEDHKMSATFFMLGSRYATNEDIVRLVHNSHSEVGYHNYTHTYYTTETPEQIRREFMYANNDFYNITGENIKLTRPPYGDYNKETLDNLETPVIRWNLDTNDWRYKELDYLTNYVMDNYSDGDIILMHDSYETSVEAALVLMDMLYLKDVQVVSVTELANIQNIELEAHKAYYYFK